MLVNPLHLLGALSAAVFATAGDSAWHLDYVNTLVNEALDPVVNPNTQSSHMHKIIGGSRMAAYYNFDDYAGAKCSSLRVQADKSNYWMPNLYVLDNAGTSNVTFTPVPAKIRFYYFLAQNSDAELVTPFPKGLRMLTGNPNNKAATSVGSFTCQINSGFTDSVILDNFNFERDCPWGMKTELYFPPCWDGVNLYKSDGSHMSYPSQDVRDGSCPWSHPVRLPAIQLEYTWYTSYHNPETALKGNLAWANGDTTGYGIHGDFVNGWDIDVLTKALHNDTSCRQGKATPMDECLTLYASFDASAQASCTPEKGTLTEPILGNADLVTIPRLPECNPVWGSSGSKPTCSPAVAGIDVSSFKGTDGAYIASTAERRDYVAPTTPGWHTIACLADISSLTGGVSYTDSSMTQESCQSTCLTAGYQYAATGQQGSTWNCKCGTGINSKAQVRPGMCTVACPGNSAELCGGSYLYNIYYAPNGTTSSANSTRSDGSSYLGCYSNPSPTTAGLLGQSTYNFSSNSMTTEVCIQACAGQGSKWAATNSQKNCFCGTSLTYGTGTFVNENQCTTKCSGNSSEICGDYYKDSVYDISQVTGAAVAGYAAGYQGCYTDSGSHLGLTANSWTLSSMSVNQCINGCSELGYGYAGLYSGSQCYCGNTPSSSKSVLPTSQCQTKCAGNSTGTCGGGAAMDLYTVTSATVTPATVAAKKPSSYLGCFKDAGSNLAFSDAYSYSATTMSVDICKSACQELGYAYSGVENGNQCKCGAAAPSSQQMVSSLYCTTNCTNTASQTCGASGYIEAYSLANSTASTAMPGLSASAYVGCYQNSDRVLSTYSYTDSSLTVESCRSSCSGLGYSLASVYIGNSCGCGNSISSSLTKLPASQCRSYTCKGNTTEYCGGSTQAAIYNTTGSATSTSAEGYTGCYSPGTFLTSAGLNYNGDYMTTGLCRRTCRANSYSIAALTNGNACYCGNSTSYGAVAASSVCNAACSGNSTLTCGGTHSAALSVYDTTGAGSQPPSGYPANYVGCITDNPRKLPNLTYTNGGMSSSLCKGQAVKSFGSGGLQYGTENGNECYAAPLSVKINTPLFPESYCTSKCAGNSAEICGSGGRLSWYIVQGNAAGGTTTSAAATSTTSKATTPAVSTSASSSAAASSTSSAAGATTSGITVVDGTTYLGCYSDSGTDHTLNGTKSTTNTMTAKTCVSYCSGLGYAYAGVEYYNECYCGSYAPLASRKDSTNAKCLYACKGDSTQFCGGGGRVAIYQASSVSSSAAISTSKASSVASTAATSTTSKATTPAVSTSASSSAAASSTSSAAGATTSGITVVDGTTYLGCYSDSGTDHTLNGTKSTTNTMTAKTCVSYCSGLGYAYAGVEYYNECYCGSYAPLASRKDSTNAKCLYACKGDSTQFCGGGGRVAIYQASSVSSSAAASTSKASSVASTSAAASSTSKASTTSAAASTSKASTSTSSSSSAAASSTSLAITTITGSTYLGCYSDSGSDRTLNGTKSSTSTMTAKTCVSYCAGLGYQYAGLEYYNECYCGNTAPASTKKDSTNAKCLYACKGDSTQTCGGSARLGIYYTSSVSTTKAARRSLPTRASERDISRVVHRRRGLGRV
ncbi:hypothetical protein B9479_006901 [Cryptococcus floricola]|uniref:WSC domain-containing protein n=1 Tax=Cryptococcus floricola TaxID=2591691 RepID=A0A5D3ALW3_9TREE|nr:hypothetical protein B9479_006901 [Cryptococcus floricola]